MNKSTFPYKIFSALYRSMFVGIQLLVFFFILQPAAYAANVTFNSSGTWTAPAGVTQVTVQAWGGGGGGATGGFLQGGGGGGGGAYASRSNISVTPGNTYTVTVGAAVGAGTGGNSSSFLYGSQVIALGGAAGTVPNGGIGGAAGSSTGDVRWSGGNGGNSGLFAGGGGGGGSAFSTANGGN